MTADGDRGPSGPKPGDETTELRFVCDARNRLVQVTDASDNAVAEYRFDGLGCRMAKLVPDSEYCP
jgi:YD repeat-containing protein